MSYILDALKRAESERERERERGTMPSVHSQPASLPQTTSASRTLFKPVTLLLMGLVAVLFGLALWNGLRLNSPLLQPVATLTLPQVPPVVVEPSPLPLVTASSVAVHQPKAETLQPAASRTAPLIAATTRTTTFNPTKIQQPAASKADLNNAPVVLLSDLSADIRMALPKLVISGSTYSDNPAHRMLIINGQVFHEGDKTAPNLELERIKPKTAVFNFKGQRYSMAY